MTPCIDTLRHAARAADQLAAVADARVAETDVGPVIEVTLRDADLVPGVLTRVMDADGLALDLRRSGVRDNSATVVYR